MSRLFFRNVVPSSKLAMSIKEQKTALRKEITLGLKSLDSEELQRQSFLVTQKILDLNAYRRAKSISIFLSMPKNEISTRQIVLRALKDNKEVFVPYIHESKDPKTKVMSMLQLRDDADFESLEADAWGIPSLPKSSIDSRRNVFGGVGFSGETSGKDRDSSQLDLLFLPAVAFDRFRNRLGHGKGFYDRFLQDLRNRLQPEQEMPLLVGLALTQQLLPFEGTIPTSENDWKADLVISADGGLSE